MKRIALLLALSAARANAVEVEASGSTTRFLYDPAVDLVTLRDDLGERRESTGTLVSRRLACGDDAACLARPIGEGACLVSVAPRDSGFLMGRGRVMLTLGLTGTRVDRVRSGSGVVPNARVLDLRVLYLPLDTAAEVDVPLRSLWSYELFTYRQNTARDGFDEVAQAAPGEVLVHAELALPGPATAIRVAICNADLEFFKVSRWEVTTNVAQRVMFAE